MHFVTRERIHVDRIATAWAIRRFVDPRATFEMQRAGHGAKQVTGRAAVVGPGDRRAT